MEERSIRPVQTVHFEWLVAQSQLQRLERTLRELRITALTMSVVLMTFVAGLFSLVDSVPSASLRITLLYGSVFWGMTYVSTLLLPTLSHSRRLRYSEVADVDAERFDCDLEPREQVRLLESTRYQVLRTGRYVRIVTQLVAFGMLLTLTGLAYSIMVGW